LLKVIVCSDHVCVVVNLVIAMVVAMVKRYFENNVPGSTRGISSIDEPCNEPFRQSVKVSTDAQGIGKECE